MDFNKTPFRTDCQTTMSEDRKTLGGLFAAQKWAANFSLPNSMLASTQYKYIKGTENTKN